MLGRSFILHPGRVTGYATPRRRGARSVWSFILGTADIDVTLEVFCIRELHAETEPSVVVRRRFGDAYNAVIYFWAPCNLVVFAYIYVLDRKSVV